MNLDRYWRENIRKEKKLRKTRESRSQVLKTNIPVNTRETQKQQLSQSQVWLKR